MPGAHEQGTEVRSGVGERFLPSLSLNTPRPPDFWAVLQEMGADFAMGSDFCVVSRGRCVALIPLTWGNVGILKPFWLNSPAKPPRSHERVRRSSR